MKNKLLICIALSAALLALVAHAGDKQTKLEAKAKITKAEAQKIALAKVPGGTIKDCEIEKENGRLIRSFDIAVAGTKQLTEVEVDAQTGEVISPAAEVDEDDDKKGDKDKDRDDDKKP